jgi:hypothetical protein
MRLKSALSVAALILLLLNTIAWADQIILKDGKAYSGKFVRGDSKIVDFRILGRIESFNTSEIAQIVFKEPVLEAPSKSSATIAPKAAVPQAEPTSSTPIPTAPASTRIPTVSPAPSASETPSRPRLIRKEEPQPSDYPSTKTTFPVGTPLTIRTSSAIDTDRNRVGDVFNATLEEALVSGETTLVPRGAAIKGRIAYSKESGKLSGQSMLILELTELDLNGKSYLLRTSDYSEVGSSRANRTAATVGGTAALGAIIGAIAGGGKGAAVGAASGAAVGTGVQVLTRGQVLKIPAETILEFRLQSPLNLDVP